MAVSLQEIFQSNSLSYSESFSASTSLKKEKQLKKTNQKAAEISAQQLYL